ncbi:hypothetical protein T5B8_09961 [Salinisphaera sp. T5B8]
MLDIVVNLLAHLLIAEYTHTSFAGQILGDEIKGRLDDRFAPTIRHGIRLHRAIDGHSDAHSAHRRLRNRFDAPLRRYAGILVDIGLDHALARAWPQFHDRPLEAFARDAQRRVIDEWPAQAPFAATRLQGLETILVGYRAPQGIQRALDSVARRLRRDNPVAAALPALEAQQSAFDQEIALIMRDLYDVISCIDRTPRTDA